MYKVSEMSLYWSTNALSNMLAGNLIFYFILRGVGSWWWGYALACGVSNKGEAILNTVHDRTTNIEI